MLTMLTGLSASVYRFISFLTHRRHIVPSSNSLQIVSLVTYRDSIQGDKNDLVRVHLILERAERQIRSTLLI